MVLEWLMTQKYPTDGLVSKSDLKKQVPEMFCLKDATVLRRHQERANYSAIREGLGMMRQLFSVSFSGSMERWAPGLIERRMSAIVT